MKKVIFAVFLTIFLLHANTTQKSIVIQEQGSFAVGGTVITNDGIFDPYKQSPIKIVSEGQTLHGDHAYVFYQKPIDAKPYPLVFLHGAGQFSKTWETTPDGREGFQNIFLKKGFSVYLVDQPRRGGAGRSTLNTTINAMPDEQFWFGNFRIGIWPNYFKDVQFPKDKESLNQYFRQMTPNTGPFDINIISDSIAKLFDKTGNGILITHSQGGGVGWYAAIKNPNIKAIISYEPGSNFVFPKNEVPKPMVSSFDTLKAVEIPMEDFMKLTKIPIVIYYGDFIPKEPMNVPGDIWRTRLEMARLWAKTVNKYGGNATVIHLPEIGVYGNTHFPFSDLNNIKIADLLSEWLNKNKLD